LQGML